MKRTFSSSRTRDRQVTVKHTCEGSAVSKPFERKRSAGRPVEFEHTRALDAALKTFWRCGYGGASMDVLTAAMAINKPSLYAAFGNKQSLYEASVDHYIATIGATYLAPLKARRIRTALRGFYAATIEGITGKHGPRGCIVACTLPAEAGATVESERKLAAVLQLLDGALEQRLKLAQAAGEIAKQRDARVLAQLVTSGMLALSIRARAGMAKPELKRMANALVEMALA